MRTDNTTYILEQKDILVVSYYLPKNKKSHLMKKVSVLYVLGSNPDKKYSENYVQLP